jgi:hypothetical protein
MSRGVLYITWPGSKDAEIAAALDRSIASLAVHHPDIPYHVAKLPAGSSMLDKSRMFDLSPFDETLFLDADTMIAGKLDYGFAKARQFDLACCICECPWARRFTGLESRGDIIEYNCGVIFFTRRAAPVFDRWKVLSRTLPCDVVFYQGQTPKRMLINDQPSFAAAVEDTGVNPFVLPINWNFRVPWHTVLFGPLRVWHSFHPMSPALEEWNKMQDAPDSIINATKLS